MIHLVASMLLTSAAVAAALPNLCCKTQSQPNPIAKDRPTEITGTINGTTAIVPVPYDVTRSMTPAQSGILREAYEKLIPSFPKDMYPAEFEGVWDHDAQSNGIKAGDFQVPKTRPTLLRRTANMSSASVGLPTRQGFHREEQHSM